MGGAALRRLLLFSGGVDSTALTWTIRPELCLTIDYGQLAAAGEIRAAGAVCTHLGLPHRVLTMNCSALGTGDMAGTCQLPMAPVPEWWPFRNQLLITVAAVEALKAGLEAVVIGTVSTDAVHADGRQPFFEAMQTAFSLQEGGLRLETPALGETTVSLCQRAAVPHSVLAWSHSCHVSAFACGTCRGCCKHRESMKELGFGEY